jgi:hypothetical protein
MNIPVKSQQKNRNASQETSADALMNNQSPGDRIMEDDLTEERYPTPAEREDVAEGQAQDP